jgi:hypothetical protein|uniref:RING-type domain-containing protein n=1 Tax=viral metagenome TaxID=1070528 RepID=A0A6C0IYW0_9ZZZZ
MSNINLPDNLISDSDDDIIEQSYNVDSDSDSDNDIIEQSYNVDSDNDIIEQSYNVDSDNDSDNDITEHLNIDSNNITEESTIDSYHITEQLNIDSNILPSMNSDVIYNPGQFFGFNINNNPYIIQSNQTHVEYLNTYTNITNSYGDIIEQYDINSDNYVDSNILPSMNNNVIYNPVQFFGLNNNPYIVQNNQTSEEYLNIFTNIINSINIPAPEIIETANMEDVRVTLDDTEFDNIKTEELQEDLNDKCSICMMEMNKGNEVSKLCCEHNFHNSCIMQWLTEYNYKCPVCRKECGKAKYNI